MSVRFGTPPAKTRRHEVHAVLDELKSRPGEWGVIRTYPKDQMRRAHSYASHIRSGGFPAFRGCDAYAATNGDVTEVWARWVQ